MITAALRRGLSKWEIYSSSLTWQATITKNKATQTIENAYMTKVPYTVFAADKNTTRDTYNFTDGLEQRYGCLLYTSSSSKITLEFLAIWS